MQCIAILLACKSRTCYLIVFIGLFITFVELALCDLLMVHLWILFLYESYNKSPFLSDLIPLKTISDLNPVGPVYREFKEVGFSLENV